VRPQRIVLEHHADVPLVRRQIVDAAPAEVDVAGIRRVEAGQEAQQRRLAASRRPEEREQLPGPDLERDGVDGGDGREPLDDRPQRDGQGFFQTASMSERNFVFSASERRAATASS
jgi:hypothetical protein